MRRLIDFAMRFTLLLIPILLHAMPAGANTHAGSKDADPSAALSQQLTIRLDPDKALLHGETELTVHDGAAFEILLDARFEADPIRSKGAALSLRPRRDGGLLRWSIPAGAPGRTLHLAWHGSLDRPSSKLEHRDTLGQHGPTATPDGTFLPSGSIWYPTVTRAGAALLFNFTLQLDLPDTQRGVVAGTLRSETVEDGRIRSHFEFAQPAEGIDLVAGPYAVRELAMQSIDGRPITLRTYFHPELNALADGYLESVRDYISLYEGWIGAYPYESFSVVSSPTPTGFGMPTFTYLGIEVLKLPFIRFTSLGHEVLHNWWGNGVYPDYARGNWSEGLTTFMADYTYAARDDADKARTMRLGWLRDLSGIPAGADRPLAEFTSRRHGISQAVGYGKAAMLFVMLRDRLGEPAFNRGLQHFWRTNRFRVAGWNEIRAAFEAESGQPLDAFFAQWLTRNGLPEVSITGASRTGNRLTIAVAQTAPAYELEVPIAITALGETLERRIRVSAANQQVELELEGAHRITLDPNSQMLRRLGREEAPPILREVQLDRATRLVTLGDSAFNTAAQSLAGRILDQAPQVRPSNDPPGKESLLVIGPESEVARWLVRHALAKPPTEVAGKGDARMWTLRLPSGAPLAIVSAADAAALTAAARPLPHYRQQSWLVLQNGRALARGVWPSQPISVPVTDH